MPKFHRVAIVLLITSLPALASDKSGDLPAAFEAGWKGEKTCEVLYETDEVRVGRCEFGPGIGHERHYHNPHFGYVLEGGRLSIENEEGQTREVETVAGTSWSSDKVTVHSAINQGETTTSYLIVEPKSGAGAAEKGVQLPVPLQDRRDP